jgi:hypothetical protein
MAWFKVDDHLTSHPAGMVVGDEALGYWMRLGCWLAQFPKEGDHIPEAVAIGLLYGGRRSKNMRKLRALVDAGMLIPEGDGYRMYALLDIAGSGLSIPAWDVEVPAGRRRKIPDALRQAIYERDGNACLECGTADDLTLDHIYPWSKGGEDTFDNLRTLCRPCNSSKGARV